MDGATAIGVAGVADGEALRELTEPHRRPQVHCDRNAGFEDAEDAVQDTPLAAWQAASPRNAPLLLTGPYKIATTGARRAPRSELVLGQGVGRGQGSNRPSRPASARSCGCEPYPDTMLEGADGRAARPGGPLRADRIHLAGLRDRPTGSAASPAGRPHLAGRPRIPANEVADMLDSTVDSVNSALKRARACSDAWPRPLIANCRPLPVRPSRMRWWRSSSAHTSRPISMRWSLC